MGALQLALLLTLVPHQDTLPAFADSRTRSLVERAMARHHHQDTLVAGYRARFKYRMSFAFGRRRWAMVPAVAVEEQTGTIAWQRPNDIKVEVQGARTRSRWSELDFMSVFDTPWFVPRALGDSVQIFGQNFPDRAALHPLASDGPYWYSYALTDSARLLTPDGRQVLLYTIRVTPRRVGPALIAGRMTIDAATADVVRLSFRYVGTALWASPDEPTPDDSADARETNQMVNRILRVDADLEYSLQDQRYWMPYRQVITGEVRVPLIGDLVVPFELTTVFQDYDINGDEPLEFRVALPDIGDERPDRPVKQGSSDSATGVYHAARWEGGRYEIHTAPRDSLLAYDGWTDSLKLAKSPEEEARLRDLMGDLARLSESLPDELTGRRVHGIQYERFADILRYNRVQGLSGGLGYMLDLPGVPFTHLQGTARFGLSDSRLMASVGIVRDAPEAKLTLDVYRTLREIETGNPVGVTGNSLNALFAGHDNGDYYLAHGISFAMQSFLATGLELDARIGVEDQLTVSAEAHSGVNDFLGGTGDFPPNPPVREGAWGVGLLRLSGTGGASRWSFTGEMQGNAEAVGARLSADLNHSAGWIHGLTLRARTGTGTAPAIPQMEFRVGGLGTVRGYDYGSRRGQAFWSMQADYALDDGWGIRPVMFLDAGQAGPLNGLFGEDLLVGGGVGVSVLKGLIRLDLSHPITHNETGLRFDLVFAAPR